MLPHTVVQALGQARLDELHRQRGTMCWPAPPAAPAGSAPNVSRPGSWPSSPAEPAVPGPAPENL
jgi:hypothetical protein